MTPPLNHIDKVLILLADALPAAATPVPPPWTRLSLADRADRHLCGLGDVMDRLP